VKPDRRKKDKGYQCLPAVITSALVAPRYRYGTPEPAKVSVSRAGGALLFGDKSNEIG
jgi:hypothetical protein